MENECAIAEDVVIAAIREMQPDIQPGHVVFEENNWRERHEIVNRICDQYGLPAKARYDVYRLLHRLNVLPVSYEPVQSVRDYGESVPDSNFPQQDAMDSKIFRVKSSFIPREGG